MDKSKRLYFKSKRSFRRRLPPIGSGDRIDYRNMSLISRFISEQGKILSRRMNRLNLKQQRLTDSSHLIFLHIGTRYHVFGTTTHLPIGKHSRNIPHDVPEMYQFRDTLSAAFMHLANGVYGLLYFDGL